MTLTTKLPAYPSSREWGALSASRRSTLARTIAQALQQSIVSPESTRDYQSCRAFVTSYTRDASFQTLQALITRTHPSDSKDDKLIRKRTLRLAQIVADHIELDVRCLLDLAIVYSKNNITRVKSIFKAALSFQSQSLLSTINTDVIPSFISIVSTEWEGLYGFSKATFCISAFLHSSPDEITRIFSRSKNFVTAVATAYQVTCNTIARTYGGFTMDAQSRELDEWEALWLECKVSLMDSFHIVNSILLRDLAKTSGREQMDVAEIAFDILFAISDIPLESQSSSSSDVPFLNQSLLNDYQQTYNLSKVLDDALKTSDEKDARLDILETMLKSYDPTNTDKGALKLLLRSSGLPPNAEERRDRKGKMPERARPIVKAPPSDPEIDLKVTQVLDIFPDQSVDYIKSLLSSTSLPYQGNPEMVIAALLDGTAPPFEDLHPLPQVHEDDDLSQYVQNRRNVFDDEEMEVSQLRFGKKNEGTSLVPQDRSHIEEMKAIILRRAEEISDDDLGNDEGLDPDSDLEGDAADRVKIAGDGEASSGDEDDTPEQKDSSSKNPETVCELAYIRDPNLFNRDANTRRSTARQELKNQTGWTDEQLEGWRIMLDRNPQKEKILQKHEFSGNRSSNKPSGSGEAATPSKVSRGGPSRGRGRGGRGGASGGNTSDDKKAQAWKDKNKARQANHNRKRGHDKKMARAGGGPPEA